MFTLPGEQCALCNVVKVSLRCLCSSLGMFFFIKMIGLDQGYREVSELNIFSFMSKGLMQ